MSIVAKNMIKRIQTMHKDFKKWLKKSNVKYKEDADKHKKLTVFQKEIW